MMFKVGTEKLSPQPDESENRFWRSNGTKKPLHSEGQTPKGYYGNLNTFLSGGSLKV